MKLSKDELASLAADVRRLSTLLTKERETLPLAYLRDAGLRKAYLLYFLPSNLPKILIPLRELFLHPKNILSKERLRILDIGSGPGTALLGALEFFDNQVKKPFLECIAVDQVAENLTEAEALFRQYRHEHSIEASLHIMRGGAEGLESLVQGRFDLIILSNLLNELYPGDEKKINKRIERVKQILDQLLARDGSCIIIEPSLRETSREMLMVRDGLLDNGFHVFSPCLMNGKCPVFANPRDWCHEDVPWDPPMVVKEIDARIGLRKDSLKFSYLVIRKDGLSSSDLHGADSFRVVSEPLMSKGKTEFYICGRGERRLVTRLDKDKTSLNESFRNLKRGDIVVFKGLVDEGRRFKVSKETGVILRKEGLRRAALL